jgi:D-3-phosphoglycerate dehydrogenase
MRILVAESSDFGADALKILNDLGEVDLCDIDRSELIQRVHDVDVLWVRLRTQIDKDVLDAAPILKVIATPTTGLTHIDLAEAERRSIQVVSLADESEFLKTIRATAELTVGLTLALLRRIPSACSHVYQGLWDRELFKGRELSGKTVGIVGYGRLGRIVGDYYKVFGCEVQFCDIVELQPADGVEQVTREQLLKTSDIVSLHANYTPTNHGLINADEFGAMKRGAVFINISRGELVDEHAMLEALMSGHLAGAAADVLQGEQTLDKHSRESHPLVCYAREHDNLIITPHIGGCTWESMENTERFLAEKLRTWGETTCPDC